MSDILQTLMTCRTARGEIDHACLRQSAICSIPVAERMDRQEYDRLIALLDKKRNPLSGVVTVEYGHTPQYLEKPDVSAFFELTVRESYKDIFARFGDEFALWLPGSEDWYVIFSTAAAYPIVAPLREEAVTRFREWLDESHHSEAGRRNLRAVFRNYNIGPGETA